MISLLGSLLVVGCSKPPALPVQAKVAGWDRVAVVINSTSPESATLGRYYMVRRGIPASHMIVLQTSTSEEIRGADYRSSIEAPVNEALKKMGGTIDYIVTTKGMPIRIMPAGYSVDGHLATMRLPMKPIQRPEPDQIHGAANPYFGKSDPFSVAKYGFFLVTHLDGYTLDDAKALVDRSIDAKPTKGPFYLDVAPNRDAPGFKDLNDALRRADDVIKGRGAAVTLEDTKAFGVPSEPLMGYASWGSNDWGYKKELYNGIKFRPGAIAETFVSTSARTFAPTTGGQSLISDLIAQGVTGVKGYVSEPFTFALARPDILFGNYLAGRNLAESFYSASPVLKWKDIVIGDPLCAPFAK